MIKRLSALVALVMLVASCSTAPASSPVAPTPTAAVVSQTRPDTPAPTSTTSVLPTLMPSSVPPAPTLRQLTTGGCCVQPYWSRDGSQVLFIDRPNETSPSGIWGVNASGGEPQFITDRLGIYSPDSSLIAYPESGRTYIERATRGGERWVAPSEGQAISFSPNSQLILWTMASSTFNLDRRSVQVWIANADGGNPRVVADLTGGGVSGWFPDSQRVLVSGRDPASNDSILAVLNLNDGSLTQIARGPRLRGGTLSPQGGWVVYQVTFSGDPTQDGLWVAKTNGSGARRLDVFGAYRWRSEGRLLMIPLEMNAASHRLVELDVSTGQVRALTDPAGTAFRVAGGDWSVSPDGNRVAFVSAADHNIWVIDLPPS